jgi:hypothetical protein
MYDLSLNALFLCVRLIYKRIFFIGRSQTWPACPSDKSSMKQTRSMEHLWYDVDRKTEVLGGKKTLSKCHFKTRKYLKTCESSFL